MVIRDIGDFTQILANSYMLDVLYLGFTIAFDESPGVKRNALRGIKNKLGNKGQEINVGNSCSEIEVVFSEPAFCDLLFIRIHY